MASVTLDGRPLALAELVQRGWLHRDVLTLDVGPVDAAVGETVELRDPEGVLLGGLVVTEPPAGEGLCGRPDLAQPPPRYDHPDLRVDRAALTSDPAWPALVVPAGHPLDAAGVAGLHGHGPVVLLTLVGATGADDHAAQTLVRAHRLHAARLRAAGVDVRHLVLPLDPAADAALVEEVVTGLAEDGASLQPAPPATGDLDREVADLLARRVPGPAQRGLTLLFTGLSGSGKSTVAGAVMARLHAETDRTITLLDGDLVRQHLSSELTFSREHRDLNVTRIGFVAAQVTKHRGVAICAPIAPYAATRQRVREMVEAHGTFVLIHVATPLEVCEQRDRKGLYAKARAGEIAAFTGISDPYEEPASPDLRLDTSTMSVAEAADAVLVLLRGRGLVEAAAG